MTTERRVRANFDLTKEYSVDVSKCTEAEKKQVQQAFFDVGIHWAHPFTSDEFRRLDRPQYSNTRGDGRITRKLLTSRSAEDCNMTATEFLELVYEPEQRGHVHADLMAQYAEDAKTTDKPWELWQIKTCFGEWVNTETSPAWLDYAEYRRKPKNHTVNGVEVPDLRIEPTVGDMYYLADPTETEFTYKYTSTNDNLDAVWAERGLCYEHTEEGRQAAIMHAKAWLGVAV